MSITRLNIKQTTYRAIHHWIQKHHGKANSCSNPDCSGKSKSYGWALIKGKSHDRNIENYKPLCASCHSNYDFDEETRSRRRTAMIGKNLKLTALQDSIIKHSYKYGATVKELASAFGVSVSAINHRTKGINPYRQKQKRDNMLRKYNIRQVNVLKASRSFGASYSDLARLINGDDRDRANIYKVINGRIYV